MRLRVIGGAGDERVVRVGGPRFVIGRDEGCDLVLDDDEVSREHAYLAPLPDGAAEIHDLGSSNGTRVDGSAIRTTAVLRGGETVRVGTTTIEILRDPAADPRALVLAGVAALAAAGALVVFASGLTG